MVTNNVGYTVVHMANITSNNFLVDQEGHEVLNFNNFKDETARLEAYVLIFMAGFACVCCLFCYIGFYCAQSHFESHQESVEMNREAATYTINTVNQRLTASDEEVRFESDIDGSITNLNVVQIRFHKQI